MSQADASRIVGYLLKRGFTQTEIARGLGLGAKGSGSYVGQIARGVKGARKVAELRQLESAVKGQKIAQGRTAEAKAARARI
ncbi:hypothetical protein, partial [Streptomyces sp. SID7909]|uniref:hypothetical protein n=1 Tax=Streptomyces sp. SID7909 TaxID=2706092 RepID=UPI0013B81372